MLKTIFGSFLLAFHNIRSHFFHTLLSVLGIVIGVAALVSILSLIDGLEGYAKDQITKTTDIKAIAVRPQLYTTVNGVRVQKDTFSVIGFTDYESLAPALSKPATIQYMTSFPASGMLSDSTGSFGAVFYGLGSREITAKVEFLQGEIFTEEELRGAEPLALVNLGFVKAIDSTRQPADFIGKTIRFRSKEVQVKAVFDDQAREPHIAFPLTLMTVDELKMHPPAITVLAAEVTDVPALKEDIRQWVEKRFRSADDYAIITNEQRVNQALKGFQLFRIVMGLIVGISVVVGGIGIMNVLLISITERTVEIGIRKAVGANRRDIILQFLAESVTVSVFGSLMGLTLGVLGTMAAVPIITAITGIPFYADYTLNTLLVVSILAVMLGIVFGTYPAIRASRLDPVEAIRHE